MSADEYQVAFLGKFLGHLVGKGDAVCCQIDDFAAIFLDSRAADGVGERFWPDDHSRFAAIRHVVHLAVIVDGKVAQVDGVEFHQSFALGATHD